MELHQLKCFLELSKFQNVSLTAEHLNISQPALSKTISLLESELGIKLFDRVGRRIQLNSHGEYFARYAEQALATLQEGTLNVKKMDYQPTATISIGLFSYFDFISDCIHSFSEQYPNIRFEIFSSKTQYTIDNFDNIDFTLSSSLGEQTVARDGFLESIPIEKEQYVLVIAPELLERYAPTVEETPKLSSLFRVPFLTMADNLMFADITYTFCLQAGFTPNVLIRTNDYATKLHLTSFGMVAAFIPEICIPVFRALRPDLKFLYFSDVEAMRTIYLSRKKSTNVSPTVQTFWDYAKKFFPVG